MKKTLLISMMICAGVAANSQTPQLVEDIVAGTLASDPQRLTVFNDKIYFTAKDAGHGRELWEWHAIGTPAVRITDLATGTTDGAPAGFNSDPMYVYKGRLYFFGKTSINNTSLMAYDGTNPPVTVRSLTQSRGTVNGPGRMVQYGNKMYYTDDSAGAYINYLYGYNGISAPVQLSHGFASNNWTGGIMPYRGKLYGSYDNITNGGELGAYDTASGTLSLVAEFQPGKYSGGPHQFLDYGGKLYFTAQDSLHGHELFSYDGVTFKRLTDIQPGSDDGTTSVGNGLAVFKGSIYFSAQRTTNHHVLYKYDTTTKAATMAYDPAPGLPSFNYPYRLFSTPNNLYFYYGHPTTGSELYQYDGVSGKLVADLYPGKSNGAGFSNMVLYHNYIYFCGNDSIHSNELFRLSGGENTGIQSANWNGDVRLYPNPATTSATLSITLSSPQSLTISLTDITGRRVFTSGAAQSFTTGRHDVFIPLQNLVAGQYFYRISNNDGGMLASGVVVKE